MAHGQPAPAGTPGGPATACGTRLGLPLPVVLALLGGACLSFLLMRGVAASGDETFYHRTAGHIAAWLLGRRPGVPFVQLVDQVVGDGWFIPGMPLLLTPVQLLCGGEAPVAWCRAWVIAVNATLLALIARVLLASGVSSRLVLGGVAASFLVPFYTSFMGCFWGELVATHAAILLMLVVERRIATCGPRAGAAWGAAIGLITLCRPQFFLLLGLVAARAVLARGDGVIATARNLCGGLAALVAAWCVVLAPWQWALDARYGPFFLVVSTAEQPFVNDPAYRAKHRLSGPAWDAVHRELVTEAARNGRSLSRQISVSRQELARPSFAARVRWQGEQARKFYFDENKFLERFRGIDRAAILPEWASAAVRRFNSAAWRAWLVAGLVLMVFPFAAGAGLDYRMPFVFKGLAGIVAVQPIVYAAHGRYHVSLIPLISVFAAVALATGARVPGPAPLGRLALRAVEAGAVLLAGATILLLVAGAAG